MKTNLSYIRRFGCTEYDGIPTEKLQKLDDKARKLTFVGYEEETKGYRLLHTTTNRVYVSKDVIFIKGDPHISYSRTESGRNAYPELDKNQTKTEVEILTQDNISNINPVNIESIQPIEVVPPQEFPVGVTKENLQNVLSK